MPEPVAQGLSETGRVEAFSDGVFAIAITLLVLEIQVPPPEQTNHGSQLLPALLRLWPSYLGYLISFVTVGIMCCSPGICRSRMGAGWWSRPTARCS